MVTGEPGRTRATAVVAVAMLLWLVAAPRIATAYEEASPQYVMLGLQVRLLLDLRQKTGFHGLDGVIRAFVRVQCYYREHLVATLDSTPIEELFALSELPNAAGIAGCGALQLRTGGGVWGRATAPRPGTGKL